MCAIILSGGIGAAPSAKQYYRIKQFYVIAIETDGITKMYSKATQKSFVGLYSLQ